MEPVSSLNNPQANENMSKNLQSNCETQDKTIVRCFANPSDEFPVAALTKAATVVAGNGGVTVSQSRRTEVRNPGAARAAPPLQAPGEGPPWPLWLLWLLALLGS